MEQVTGFDKFVKAVIAAIQTVILPSLEDDREALTEAVGNHLFDRPGPKRLEANPTRDERFITKIFSATSEILSATETLRDIELYIRRFPYRGTRITKPRHLRYHAEAFLNEVYLLKERLIALLTVVERSYKRDARADLVRSVVQPLYTVVNEALKNPVLARGSHIHEERFSDYQIGRLEMLDLLTNPGNLDSLKGYYGWEYRKIRKEWKDRIKENNEGVHRLLDFVADDLYPVLFDKDGEIVVPKPRAA